MKQCAAQKQRFLFSKRKSGHLTRYRSPKRSSEVVPLLHSFYYYLKPEFQNFASDSFMLHSLIII